MSIKKLNLKYRFNDKFLNIVLEDYKDKINYMIDNVYNTTDADAPHATYVPLTRTISTTAPLSGGGALSSNLTISLGSMSWAGTANYLIGVQDYAADGWEYKSLLGTTNQITVTHAAVDAEPKSYGTITLTTPQDIDTDADVVFDTCTLDNNGLHLLDTNASHDLIITPGSNLTADRVLTLTTGDAARTLTLSGNLTVESSSLINQDLTTNATGVRFASLGLHEASIDAGCYLHLTGANAKIEGDNKGLLLKDTGANASEYKLYNDEGFGVYQESGGAGAGARLKVAQATGHWNFQAGNIVTTGTLGAGNATLGTIGCNEITVADGHGINLQEDITFTGATTENLIKMPDNLANALSIMEGANAYMTFVTTNGSESIAFGKAFDAPTGCTIGNLTLADGSITDSSGAISFGDGNVYINDTANSNMTIGLTINQNQNSNEILAFRSPTSVAHGITDYAETDIYGDFQKAATTSGGLHVRGFSENDWAFTVDGIATSDNTGKNATAKAPIVLRAGKKSGTAIDVMGADANLLVVRNWGGTRFIVDEDGDVLYDGTAGAYQDHDDIKLVQELDDILSKKIKPDKIKDTEVASLGVVNEAGFVSTKKKNMLLYGTIKQLNDKIISLQEEINKLKTK